MTTREKEKVEQCFYSTHFYNDPVVKLIKSEFGVKGYTTILYLIGQVGSSYNLRIKYDEEFIHRMAELLPEVSANLLDMIIRKLAKKNFFDKHVFNTENIITPPDKYLVNTPEEVFTKNSSSGPYYMIRPLIKHDKTEVNVTKTPVIATKTQVNAAKTQKEVE
ncbi:MAG: DUF4373 domain-containing protein [Cyanobacteria bacterium RUI128]|nr:DUF4373 domain-containing protein [Cyanobacteria bacterium RUI128]